MRHAKLSAALASALAAALCIASPSALAQEQPEAEPLPEIGVSTGYNLLPQSLDLIEATRAGVAFEAVSDTRFRLVRHMATRFPCSFLPTSAALVTIVAAREGAAAADDAVCLEEAEGAVLAYRITRFSDRDLDQVFADARTAEGGYLSGGVSEIEGAPAVSFSPHQPDVELDMPRRQVLLIGDSPQGRAMLRIAVVQLSDGWFLTQNYFAPLTQVEEGQQTGLAMLGSSFSEAALAVSLSEMLSPTKDPVLRMP